MAIIGNYYRPSTSSKTLTGYEQSDKSKYQSDFYSNLADDYTEENPFSVLGEDALTSSRIGSAQTEFSELDSTAETLAGEPEYATMAGDAMADIDSQFATQNKANQLTQSRMGLDPSQMTSSTANTRNSITQAVARAGAMQSARRQAEQNQVTAKSDILSQLTSSLNNSKAYQQQSMLNTQASNTATQQSALEGRMAYAQKGGTGATGTYTYN